MRVKLLRRGVLVAAVLAAVACIILLLNITASNPTGRRYSSEMPSNGGTSAAIGTSGERVLARDLGVPRNEQPDRRQCICDNAYRRTAPPVTECRVCSSFGQLTATYRRPDFLTDDFMAEAKNTNGFVYTGREINQIGDYVIAARAMNVPLWVYVRVNSSVDPEFVSMVESTGGGVVRYFTVPGHTDPIDETARTGLIIAGGLILLILLIEWVDGRGGSAGKVPRSPGSGPDTGNPADLIERAKRKNDRLDADLEQNI